MKRDPRSTKRQRKQALSTALLEGIRQDAAARAARGETSCVSCGGLVYIGAGAKLRIRTTTIDGAFLVTAFCRRCYSRAN